MMKRINIISIMVMLIINSVCLMLTILGKFNSNILVCLATYFIVFLPKILRKLLKIEIPDSVEFVFLLFIFFAEVLGSVLHFYHLISWFDSFVHYVSGILTALLGLMLLVYLKRYDSKDICFNLMFMISITLSVAALWEIFEFTNDSVFGYNAQRVIETGVTDTMKDIICALLGCILVVISYIYEERNSKKLLISKFLSSIKKVSF